MDRYRVIRPAIVVATVGLGLGGVALSATAQTRAPSDKLDGIVDVTTSQAPLSDASQTTVVSQDTAPVQSPLRGPATTTLNSTDGSVTLRWSGLPPGVEGVRIYRDGTAVATVSGDPGSYADGGLTPGSTYSYAVVTYAGNLESPRSNMFTVTVREAIADREPPDVAAPTTPTPTSEAAGPTTAAPVPPTTTAPPPEVPTTTPTATTRVEALPPAASPDDAPAKIVQENRTTIDEGSVHVTQTNSVTQTGSHTVVNSNSVVIGS